jgi:hypothetical protein
VALEHRLRFWQGSALNPWTGKRRFFHTWDNKDAPVGCFVRFTMELAQDFPLITQRLLDRPNGPVQNRRCSPHMAYLFQLERSKIVLQDIHTEPTSSTQ